LCQQAQIVRRYIRKDFSTKLTVNAMGYAIHNPCVSHCLQHAFGDCHQEHYVTCDQCESLFVFFKKVKANVNIDHYATLDSLQRKLIYFQAHHA